jgi:hypothetical protein
MSAPIVYDLHLELLDSEPPIWRRLQVSSDTPLATLHQIMAVTMGWSGRADYDFKAQNPHLTGEALLGEPNRPVLLSEVMSSRGDGLFYTYNLTHGWLHKIILEAVQQAEPDVPLPYCAAGERRGPPEFCAGVWGYEELLDSLSNPDAPDCDALWEQVGYDFDPEYFDLAEVNRQIGEVLD